MAMPTMTKKRLNWCRKHFGPGWSDAYKKSERAKRDTERNRQKMGEPTVRSEPDRPLGAGLMPGDL